MRSATTPPGARPGQAKLRPLPRSGSTEAPQPELRRGRAAIAYAKGAATTTFGLCRTARSRAIRPAVPCRGEAGLRGRIIAAGVKGGGGGLRSFPPGISRHAAPGPRDALRPAPPARRV